MAYVKKAAVEKVTLDSNPDYYVMWRTKLTYGQMRDIARVGQKSDGQVDQLTASDALFLAHIESWNLDDEDGNILPLTPESLAFLDEDDANQLAKLSNKTLETQESERKN